MFEVIGRGVPTRASVRMHPGGTYIKRDGRVVNNRHGVPLEFRGRLRAEAYARRRGW
jgi:hypothetical protein